MVFNLICLSPRSLTPQCVLSVSYCVHRSVSMHNFVNLPVPKERLHCPPMWKGRPLHEHRLPTVETLEGVRVPLP